MMNFILICLLCGLYGVLAKGEFTFDDSVPLRAPAATMSAAVDYSESSYLVIIRYFSFKCCKM